MNFLLFLYLIFQRRTAPVRCAVGIRTLYVLLMSVTRATTSICGKANPALWAFVMERCEPTYSYSYEKTYIKAVFIHRSITVFTRQLEMLAFNYLNISFYSQGKCMKQVQDVIERLWDFIEKLDINTFGKLSVSTVSLSHLKSNGGRKPVCVFSGKFLADNIVGSVVVFSLIFWIPLSILVHYVVSHFLTRTKTNILQLLVALWKCSM